MKKRIGWIVVMLAAVLIGSLLAWRFWPRSFSDIVSIDENTVTDFSAGAMVQHLENGQSVTDTYDFAAFEEQSSVIGEVLDILAASDYQQDFRNLLPWAAETVDGDGNYDGCTVLLVFSDGYEKDDYVQIQFLSRSVMVVSVGGEDGFRVYHPTNDGTIDALADYIQAHDDEP